MIIDYCYTYLIPITNCLYLLVRAEIITQIIKIALVLVTCDFVKLLTLLSYEVGMYLKTEVML